MSDTVRFLVNTTPVLQVPLGEVSFTKGNLFGYTISDTAFRDAEDRELSYSAKHNEGPLMSWLSFDAGNRRFSGTMPDTVGSWRVKVSARDSAGGIKSDTLILKSIDTNLWSSLKKELENRNNYVSGDDWRSYFGCSESYPDVPSNINDILLENCPFSNNKKIYQTHMLCIIPKLCSGTLITVMSQLELWNSHKETMPNSVDAKLRILGLYNTWITTDSWSNRPVDNDQWVLMYVGDPSVENGVIPGSRGKTWTEQQALFNNINDGNYEIIDGLGAVTGGMMKYIKTREKILTSYQSNQPNTWINTKDKWSINYCVLIGLFDDYRLLVSGKNCDNDSYDDDDRDDRLGIGVVRKFR
ncbi:MAG: putative Ig domain-containing protein [Candidatus Marinamargulisbacteria bacterium]